MIVEHIINSDVLYSTTGRGRLRINKIENVGKALNFLTHQKKVGVNIVKI